MNPYYEQMKANVASRKFQNRGENYYDQMKEGITGEGADMDSIGSVYRSVLHQRGYGLNGRFRYNTRYGLGFADVMGGIFRMMQPLFKSGLQFLGNQAVNSAANIAKDVISGTNLKEAAKSELSSAAGEVFAKAPDAISKVIKQVGKKRKPVSSIGSVVQRPSDKKRSKISAPKVYGGLLKKYPALGKIR